MADIMKGHALVTGGSRGIGLAVCDRLRRDGLGVVIFDIEPPEEPALGDFFEVDLSDIAATEEALARARDKRQITRLVNNVGVVKPAFLEDASLEEFEAVMALNVRCAIQCAQAVLPDMKAVGFGRIVNISSRAALGKELRTIYAASKAALIGLTRTWALELGQYGITVNCVCPGPTATDLFVAANPPDDPRTKASLANIPVGRIGTPEDMAHAISFFLHEDSSFVSGQTLFVCGGSSVGRMGA